MIMLLYDVKLIGIELGRFQVIPVIERQRVLGWYHFDAHHEAPLGPGGELFTASREASAIVERAKTNEGGSVEDLRPQILIAHFETLLSGC
jgi:hypothetical protein